MIYYEPEGKRIIDKELISNEFKPVRQYSNRNPFPLQHFKPSL